MKKYIYDEEGLKFIRFVEAIPKCGEDFCDTCGDCLHCFGDMICMDNGTHFWVQYGKNND